MSADDQFTEFCIMCDKPCMVRILPCKTGVSLHDAKMIYSALQDQQVSAEYMESLFQKCQCIRQCAQMCGTDYMILDFGNKQCIVHRSSYDKLANAEVDFIIKQFPNIFSTE